MITVEQLLAQVQDEGMRCVAGFQGLTKAISSFTIIDTPDIIQWLKGGEFVASLGYITTTHPDMQRTLIQDLAGKGCAGMGVKMHGYYDEVPQIYIEQGNALGFPVLELPYNMRFSDLSYHIHQNIFRQNMSVMEKTYSVYEGLARLVLADASVEHMLYEISRAVGNPVVLANKDFETVAAEVPLENPVKLEPALCLTPHLPLLPRKMLKEILAYFETTQYSTYSTQTEAGGRAVPLSVIAVQAEEVLWGYLVIPETIHPLERGDHRVLENITSALSLYFMKNQFLPDLGTSHNNFLNLVLLNPQATRDSLRYYCKLFDFDFQKKRICLDVLVEGENSFSYERRKSTRNLLDISFETLCGKYGVQKYTLRYEEHFLAFLLFSSTSRAEDVQNTALALAADFLQLLQDHQLEVQLGLSSCSQELTQIPAAYKQAVEIVPLGRKMQPYARLHSYEALKVYYTLMSTLTKQELQDMATMLEGLCELDADGKSEYIATLEKLINNKFNVSKTAAEMFIHRNSMNYRLGRIRDVLAVDLENPEEVLKIQLGLHAIKLLEVMDAP